MKMLMISAKRLWGLPSLTLAALVVGLAATGCGNSGGIEDNAEEVGETVEEAAEEAVDAAEEAAEDVKDAAQ
jgi:hypothetical protein